MLTCILILCVRSLFPPWRADTMINRQKRLISSVFSSFSSPLAYALASAGVLSLLSACGGSSSSPTASADTPAQISSAVLTFGLNPDRVSPMMNPERKRKCAQRRNPQASRTLAGRHWSSGPPAGTHADGLGKAISYRLAPDEPVRLFEETANTSHPPNCDDIGAHLLPG